MSYKEAKVKLAPIKLAANPGKARRYYCPEHKGELRPVKVFGKKGMMLTCKEGHRVPHQHAIKK